MTGPKKFTMMALQWTSTDPSKWTASPAIVMLLTFTNMPTVGARISLQLIRLTISVCMKFLAILTSLSIDWTKGICFYSGSQSPSHCKFLEESRTFDELDLYVNIEADIDPDVHRRFDALSGDASVPRLGNQDPDSNSLLCPLPFMILRDLPNSNQPK